MTRLLFIYSSVKIIPQLAPIVELALVKTVIAHPSANPGRIVGDSCPHIPSTSSYSTTTVGTPELVVGAAITPLLRTTVPIAEVPVVEPPKTNDPPTVGSPRTVASAAALPMLNGIGVIAGLPVAGAVSRVRPTNCKLMKQAVETALT